MGLGGTEERIKVADFSIRFSVTADSDIATSAGKGLRMFFLRVSWSQSEFDSQA